VETYIGAITETAEANTRRAMITQEWELSLDCFPASGVIPLPLPPLQSVTSIKYLDVAGTLQTIDPSGYAVDISGEPGRVVPAHGTAWPTTQDMPAAVAIRFVCGYGDTADTVPPAIKAWIMLNVADLYENRETVVIGNSVNRLSTMADALLNPFRMVSW